MHDLDHVPTFNCMLGIAMNLGITHAGVGVRRLKSEALILALRTKAGPFKYRRFHQEILNRAYGLPFINAAKLKYAAERRCNLETQQADA